MKTHNLAIVFVDIVGFTRRTSTQSRADNQRMLEEFDALVRPVVKGFSGRIVKSIGDAYMLAFNSSTDALHCAMAILDRTAEANTDRESKDRLEVRAAVNAGDVRIDGGDVFGEPVNLASRIESKTPPGEIYFSKAVYLAMTRAEVPSEEVGSINLKGIAEPITLYRIPHASEVGGYQLTGSQSQNQPESKAALAAVHPRDLPYGGLGLARLGSRSTPKLRSQQTVSTLRSIASRMIDQSGQTSRRTVRSLVSRYHQSRRFRLLCFAIALGLLAVGVLFLWPEPEPLSGWERFVRDLGLQD